MTQPPEPPPRDPRDVAAPDGTWVSDITPAEPVTDPPRAPRKLVSVEALITLLGDPAEEGIVWRPWTDDRSIGYEITLPGGGVRHLRIEPSPDRGAPHADIFYGVPGGDWRIASITLPSGDVTLP